MADPTDHVTKNGEEEDITEFVLPPPKKTGMIILCSRPVADLAPIYQIGRRYDEDGLRKVYFAAAEPGWLVVRIASFLRELRDPEREEKLLAISSLFDRGHLIYLVERPGSGNLAMGSGRNIKVGRQLTSFEPAPILALGAQAQNWAKDNLAKEREVVSLPEPLGSDQAWHPAMLEKLRRSQGMDRSPMLASMVINIDRLAYLCSLF